MAIAVLDEVMLREPNLRIPRRSPNGECRIDKESALFKRLKPDWVFGPQQNAYWPEVNAPIFTPLSGGTFGGSPAGKAMRANGGNSDGFVSNINADFLSGATTASGFILLYSPTTAEGSIMGRWGSPPAYGGFFVFWDSNQLCVICARTNSAWCQRRTASATAGLSALGFSYDGNAGGTSADVMEMYLNGRSDNGTYPLNNGANSIQSVAYPLYVCRHGDALSGSGKMAVLFCALKANALWTAEEHAMIAADPFSMVKPA